MGIVNKITSILPFKKKENLFLTLDIGTEFIKVLLVRRVNQKGEVIGVGKCKQRLSDMQSGIVTDIWGVIENCQTAIEEAETMAGKTANQVIIGIAGELVKGHTTGYSYQRKNPEEKITLEELERVAKKIQWQAFDEVRKEITWESGYENLDVKLVNSAAVDFQIDGYKIVNPIGFQGKNVTLGVFNAFAPLVHVGALQTIAEELQLSLLSISAEPYAVARSIENFEAGDFSAIFIDIGGGTTDIALVQKGGLVGTKMFALGGRAFTKKIAQEFDTSFAKGEKMKLEYSNGKAKSAQGKKIKTTLKSDCEVWLNGIEIILEEFGKEEDILPPKILLCGGAAALPEIKQVLKSYPWTKQLKMLRKPDITLMQPDLVTNISDTTGLLVSQQDITPMGLANLGIQLTGKEHIFDTILRNVIGMANK